MGYQRGLRGAFLEGGWCGGLSAHSYTSSLGHISLRGGLTQSYYELIDAVMVSYLDHVLFGSHSRLINSISLPFRTRILFIVQFNNIYYGIAGELILGYDHALDSLSLRHLSQLLG